MMHFPAILQCPKLAIYGRMVEELLAP
jgi:hypothetical protein